MTYLFSVCSEREQNQILSDYEQIVNIEKKLKDVMKCNGM